MTYAELKSALEALTPEQLAMEVTWTGEERGGKVKYVWIAAEDWVDSGDGDCEPLSVVTDPEVLKDPYVYIPKGTPQLVVD